MLSCRQRLIAAIVLCCVVPGLLRAADGPETGFVDRTFEDAQGPHRYTVYIPENYAEQDRWPVVLYLHGAGGRGTDGKRQLLDGLAPVIRLRGRFPAVVVFPQCENLTSPILECWEAESPDGVRALRILEAVEQDYAIDPHRRVLAGWSMGGYGAWSLAAANPEHWSAVLPIAGGGDVTQAAALRDARIWAIHGAGDHAIPVERSQELVDAIRDLGGSAVISVLPGVSHDAWKHVFLSRAAVNWMLGTEPPVPEEFVREAEDIGADTLDGLDGPFEPALIVPRAVTLRLGRDALRTLSYGVPDVTPLNTLSGQLTPITCEFELDGQPLEVRLEELAYNLRLHRALINTTAAGTIELKLGLRPFEIHIGRASIAGGEYSAAADSVLIRLGHRRPVWINLALKPMVEDHRMRFRILKSEFRIPDDNWVVLPPEKVEFKGPGLTADIVCSGVVGGLYVRRQDFEENVLAVVPEMLEGIEERLMPPVAGSFAGSVWPLPVFQPRMQLMISDIAVDADGISLALDVAAANFDPLAGPAPPRVVAPIGPTAAEVRKSRDLQVHVASEAIEPLAQMFVDTGLGRIDVRDLPHNEFATLADPDELEALIPGLQELGPDIEVRSELILASPFYLDAAADDRQVSLTSADVAGIRAALDVPQVTIAIAARSPATGGEWRSVGTIDMHVRQHAAIQLNRPAFHQRSLEFHWEGLPDIDATFSGFEFAGEGSSPTGAERLLEVVRAGWQAWTADSDEAPRTVPDLEMGSTRLRLEDVAWHGTMIEATFQTPATRIVNGQTQPLVYEVRGPYSGWGRRHRLAPGESDTFDAPYPLTIRFPTQKNAPPLWLPLGSLTTIDRPIRPSGSPEPSE